MWIGARSRVVPRRRGSSFIYSRFVFVGGFFAQSIQRCAEIGQKVGKWAGQCPGARDQNIVVAGYSIKGKLSLRRGAQPALGTIPIDGSPNTFLRGGEAHPDNRGPGEFQRGGRRFQRQRCSNVPHSAGAAQKIGSMP